MDLDQTENAQIKELINCCESFSYSADEIESSIFLMIKNMKKNETDKLVPKDTVVEQKKLVKLSFWNGTANFEWRRETIDTDLTSSELIDYMSKKNHDENDPFAFFKFKGTKLEGSLKKYKLKDGDIIHYWTKSMANY